MTSVFAILVFQAIVGAFDNLWHHEWEARLPQRPSARRELALHAAREGLYAGIFLGLGWWQWHGAWALGWALVLVTEFAITVADFLEEDRSRHLPPLERALHTALAVSYGALLATLAPVLTHWWHQPTAVVSSSHGPLSWLFTAFSAGVLAWSVRNVLAVRRLGRQRPASAPQGTAPAPHAPVTLVSGATGFVGTALVAELLRRGHRVVAWARDPVQAQANLGPQVRVVQHLRDIGPGERIDQVVNLAGAPVLGTPWTRQRRRLLMDSRTGTTAALVDWMRTRPSRPEVLVCASAVGYYGVPPEGPPLDEQAPAQPGRFQSDLCAALEHEARRAEGLGVRVVRLRLGIVLGRGGGALPRLALATRWGLGAVLGSGRQPMPWIHLDDAVGLVGHALCTPGLRGPVNAVAPVHVTQAGFAAELARSLGRPLWWRVPGWCLRGALGEMAELLLEGQAVHPQAALASGYRFAHPQLAPALRAAT